MYGEGGVRKNGVVQEGKEETRFPGQSVSLQLLSTAKRGSWSDKLRNTNRQHEQIQESDEKERRNKCKEKGKEEGKRKCYT